MGFKTKAVHEGVYKDAQYNSVTTPIYPSSNLAFTDIGTNSGYDYTRSGNPTRSAAGISKTNIRLSVGIEDTEDLVGDLKDALSRRG